eukprot:TRINITY_DN7272_c0_g1_i1.p1 TRINITY_DN7272_c0_g1~~TRINITY_DN7272_c0_g1_i1.p1  ORF type:complete len:578 (+),score=54.98 TRINITY_DN7272_c0_g1_i1:204-1937(+)
MDNEKRIQARTFGRRFMKFAEKKLQKGIDYLEGQVQAVSNLQAISGSHSEPFPYFDQSTFSAAAPLSQTNNGESNNYHANYFSAHHQNFNPSTHHTAPTQPALAHSFPPPPRNGAPPPPTPFTNPFPKPEITAPQTQNTMLSNASGPIITQELLLHMQSRIPSACVSLGLPTVKEARKGLSRVLSPTRQDINLFAAQLKNSDKEAIEPNWHDLDDQLPCFAISYVQHAPQGRYKFSTGQWTNFHTVVQAIAAAGVKQFRVWLDQCLWLRDASQASWAHTGIVPYVLWPVIALGTKAPGGERTKDSFHRMWPFVEQLAGLWGMGLIIASEYRDLDFVEGNHRPWLSYNLRVSTEPEADLWIILLNIFHGAADALETGWINDVIELKEMARINVMYSTNNKIIIGSDWKRVVSSLQPLSSYFAIDNMSLPAKSEFLGDFDLYLDGSRTLKCDSWDGVREWFSGNEAPIPNTPTDGLIYIGLDKYNIITNIGEFQLLDKGNVTKALWLIVAMQGRSSNFSRGRVAWTKILTGPGSCRLREIIGNSDIDGVKRVLRDELKNRSLEIHSANVISSEVAIQWM